MADNPQDKQPSQPQAPKAPTWEEETAGFHAPGEAPAKAAAGANDDDPAKKGDDAGAGAGNGDDVDGAAAAKVGAAHPKAADAGENGKTAEGEGGKEGEPKEDELPGWLKDRVARANNKEARAEQSRQADLDRIAELEEKNAALEAAAKVKEKPALVKPKAADFESVDDYEEARDAYDAEVKAREAAAAKEPEKKAEPKKPEADKTKAPDLPAGITQVDVDAAAENIRSKTSLDIVKQLGDSKVVPVLTTIMLMHLGEQAGDRMKDMAAFVIKSPKTMAAIGALPPLRQAAALERAFIERPQAKTTSKAPAPIDRIEKNGLDRSVEGFADFEARRNAEELAERAAGRF